jgi:hypothetical protein
MPPPPPRLPSDEGNEGEARGAPRRLADRQEAQAANGWQANRYANRQRPCPGNYSGLSEFVILVRCKMEISAAEPVSEIKYQGMSIRDNFCQDCALQTEQLQ